MIRVAIQAWLPATAPSGARNRLLGIVRGLQGNDLRSHVTLHALVSQSEPADEELEAAVRALPRGDVVQVTIPARPTWRRVLGESLALQRSLRGLAFDVLDLASLPHPRVHAPTCMTIHDLRDLTEWARPGRRRFAHRTLRQAVSRAARIAVPSPDVARRLRAACPGSETKTRIVPAGIAMPARSQPSRRRASFVHVGRLEPRKAVPFLVAAYARATALHPDLPSLVLAGGGSSRAWCALRRQISRLGITHRVRCRGTVTDAERDELLSSARALAFPSRLEGFGLPVLEAMAHGTPVLVANDTATAWLAAQGGLAIEPTEEHWARALVRLAKDDCLAADLGGKARTRASEFTQAASARAALRVWNEAASH